MAPKEAESTNSLSGTKPQDAVTTEIMAIVDDHMRRLLSTWLLPSKVEVAMIRDANKVKRLDWARANLAEALRSD